MVRHKSVEKRNRQAIKANVRNKHHKSVMKTAIKKVLAENDKEEAGKKLNAAVSIIDKVAGKGIIHKNKAGNQKSRLTKFVNNLK